MLTLVRALCGRGIARDWRAAMRMRADVAAALLFDAPGNNNGEAIAAAMPQWVKQPDGSETRGFANLDQLRAALQSAPR